MCGIVGLIAPPTASWDAEAVTRRMSDTLRHRGPDSSGVWRDPAGGSVVFGHRRLAIIDLSASGHQPMLDRSQRYAITYNGEIYNYKALRDELALGGSTFRSESDTEVILEGVARWGLAATVVRLAGIFAFAIFDRQQRRLFLVRDHLGVKPLYHGVAGTTFVFASELQPFRQIPGFSPVLSPDSVDALLRYSYIPAPATIFEGVFKLPAGTIGEVNLDQPTAPLRMSTYWSVREAALRGAKDPLDGTPDEAVSALDALLRTAIGSQMISDVPLGAFLSGGIDSSTVVALMQSASPRPIRTFSIGFTEEAFNEAHAAAAVAAHLGTDHTELYVSPQDALDVIPRLPRLYDEPFADSSQIPTFLVSQLARRSVTVALSGDGGDELFAGYNRHVLGDRLWGLMKRTPHPLRRALSCAALSPAPSRYDRAAEVWNRVTGQHLPGRVGFQVHKLAALLDARSQGELYERLTSQWNGLPAGVRGVHPERGLRRLAPASFATLTERMMVWDLETYLPDDVLTKVDRASMACGLEARVPLLDPRVVEFAWRIPLGLKLRDGKGKWILRQVLQRYVPRQLVDRPKAGFAVPIDSWLRGPLREWAESLLSVAALDASGLLETPVIREVWRRHLIGERDAHQTVWNVLMFQAWYLERGR